MSNVPLIIINCTVRNIALYSTKEYVGVSVEDDF